MSQESFTWNNFSKIKDFYGVSEETLKQIKKDILEKMFKAVADEDLDALHNLGYYVFSPSYKPSEYISKFD
jgi:hypothetical protein